MRSCQSIEIGRIAGQDKRSSGHHRLGNDQSVGCRGHLGLPLKPASNSPDLFSEIRDGVDGIENPMHQRVSMSSAQRLGNHNHRNFHRRIDLQGTSEKSPSSLIATREGNDGPGVQD